MSQYFQSVESRVWGLVTWRILTRTETQGAKERQYLSGSQEKLQTPPGDGLSLPRWYNTPRDVGARAAYGTVMVVPSPVAVMVNVPAAEFAE